VLRPSLEARRVLGPQARTPGREAPRPHEGSTPRSAAGDRRRARAGSPNSGISSCAVCHAHGCGNNQERVGPTAASVRRPADAASGRRRLANERDRSAGARGRARRHCRGARTSRSGFARGRDRMPCGARCLKPAIPRSGAGGGGLCPPTGRGRSPSNRHPAEFAPRTAVETWVRVRPPFSAAAPRWAPRGAPQASARRPRPDWAIRHLGRQAPGARSRVHVWSLQGNVIPTSAAG
jgi:hypothetical protein